MRIRNRRIVMFKSMKKDRTLLNTSVVVLTVLGAIIAVVAEKTVEKIRSIGK